MKHYFENYKINYMGKHIVIKKLMQVENYGSLMVYVMKTKTLKTILLLKIIYVFDFLMNFVSINKIKLKKIYWDNLNNKLIKKNKFFCDVKRWKKLYLLENNTLDHTN